MLALLVSATATAAEPLWAPQPTGRIVSPPIGALTGLVKGPGRANTFWAINGSGDSARIFAITEDGKSILPTYSKFSSYGDEPEQGKQQWQGFEVLNAKNVDWQDISADANYLYLADTGNADGKRRDLGIYLISKIDPTASTRSAVIQFLPVTYPEPKAPDAGSLFVDHGTPYLIGGNRGNAAAATLYRLDTRNTDQPNLLAKIDSNAAIGAATGAGLSPDGKTLAVVTLEGLWLFERPQNGDHWLSAPAKHYAFDRSVLKQVEAVTWIDDATLLLVNQQRDLFKARLADLPPPSQP
ncbi:MAG TPA: hypothetical protein VMH83_05040 [Candidatus Acidoferrum sp.]|nr:hypothetical protein [Candidatus Acidoferrum sp.]